MGEKVNEELKTKKQFDVEDIKENKRAMRKLLVQANKCKENLSSNSEYNVLVEGLLVSDDGEDYDFNYLITREKFEEISEDLFQRALKPIENVFSSSGLDLERLDLLEIFGGGTRIPHLQKKIMDTFKRDTLDRHVNSDESAVFGASFFAAMQSSSFKVMDVKIKDTTPFQIQISGTPKNGKEENEGENETENEDDKEEENTLFRRFSRLNAKKTLAFKTNDPVTLKLFYEKNVALEDNSFLDLAE